MSDHDVPVAFCDVVDIGVLDGPAESVQISFRSTVVNLDGSMEQRFVFRAAMTKLAFMQAAETFGAVAKGMNKFAHESKRQAN